MSKRDFSYKQFSRNVREWWDEVKANFNYTKASLNFVSKSKIKVWIPTIVLNHYLMALVTLEIIGHDEDDGRIFRFFILNSRYYHEPALFCESRSEFNFLCNYITVNTSGATKVHIKFPTAVITKVGPYNCWYLTEWELEWHMWVKEQFQTNKKIKKYYIERRKLISSVQENIFFLAKIHLCDTTNLMIYPLLSKA